MKRLILIFLTALAGISAGQNQSKLSERDTITGAQIDGAADWIGLSDMSTGKSVKILPNELRAFMLANPTFTGTVTMPDGSITASKLAASGATSGQVLTYNGTTWAPATASGGSFASLTGNPTDNALLSSALELKVSTADTSTTGGANKVTKFDASAYLRTGPVSPLDSGNIAGGLRIPSRQRITWERESDGAAVANVWMYDKHSSSHDANYYPELVWTSPRHCYYWDDGFQMGNSYSSPGRGWRFLYFNPLGQASSGTSLETQVESIPILLSGQTWSGSAAVTSTVGMQWIPSGASAGELIFTTGGNWQPGGTSARGRLLSTGDFAKAFGIKETGPNLPSGKTFNAAGDFTLTQNSVEVLKSDSASALANTLRISNGKVRIGTGSSAAAALPFEVWRQTDAGNTTGEFYVDSNGKVFVGRLSSSGGNSSTGFVVQDRLGSVTASFNPATSASTIGGNTLSVAAVSTFSNTTDATSSTGAIRTSGGVSAAKGMYLGTLLTGTEQASEPAAPAADGYVIYAIDNGSGKTRLMVKFATGSAQELAIEP